MTFASERFPNCDSCEALMINGVYCHESGCPNAKKTWVPEREEWVRFVKCRECGCDVEEGESCDCQEPEFYGRDAEDSDETDGETDDAKS